MRREHEMAFWPQQVLSPAPRDHGSGLFGRDKRPHCAPLWLLLAGIVVIGIGIGLFATTITAIFLSSSIAQAADSGRTWSHHTRRRRVWWVFKDIRQGGRYDEF